MFSSPAGRHPELKADDRPLRVNPIQAFLFMLQCGWKQESGQSFWDGRQPKHYELPNKSESVAIPCQAPLFSANPKNTCRSLSKTGLLSPGTNL